MMRATEWRAPSMTLASPSRAVPCSPSHEASRPRPVHPLHPDRRADRGQQSPAGAARPVAAAASRRHAGLSPGDRHAAAGRAGGLGMGWWAGRHHRRRAREASGEAARLEREVQRLRADRVDAVAGDPAAWRRATRRRSSARARWSRPNSRMPTGTRGPLLVKILSAAEVDAALDDLALIDRLDALFRAGCEMPVRHHHPIAQPTGPGSADAMLLLMPAWTRGRRRAISASRWSRSSPTTAAARCPRSTASTCCSTARPARRWRCWTAPC